MLPKNKVAEGRYALDPGTPLRRAGEHGLRNAETEPLSTFLWIKTRESKDRCVLGYNAAFRETHISLIGYLSQDISMTIHPLFLRWEQGKQNEA
jgi:hypothetical protein